MFNALRTIELNPSTPVGFLTMHLRDRRARLAASSEAGVSAVEWVVITTIVVALVFIVGKVITDLVKDKAGCLSLDDAGC